MRLIDAHKLLIDIRPEYFGAPTVRELAVLKIFNEAFPEQSGNLMAFLETENCPCKASLSVALNEHPSKAQSIVDAIDELTGAEHRVFTIAKTGEMAPGVRSIAGAVINIKNDPSAYSMMLKSLAESHQLYNGLSLKDNNDGTWTLFFY